MSVIVVMTMLALASCTQQEGRTTLESTRDREKKGEVSLGQPQGLDDEWCRGLVGEWTSSAESDMAGFKCWVKGAGRVKMELGVGGQFLVVTKQGGVSSLSDEYVRHLRQDLHTAEEEIDKLRNMKFAEVEYFTIDPRTGAVVGYLFDSWRCVATGSGHHAGDTEIMEWKWSAGGQGTSVRTTKRIGADELLVTERYNLPDGGTMEDRVRMTRVR